MFVTDEFITLKYINRIDWLLQMAIVLTLTVIVTIYITMTFFLWRKRGKCSSSVDLTGKTVIITGANTGNIHTNKHGNATVLLSFFVAGTHRFDIIRQNCVCKYTVRSHSYFSLHSCKISVL